jgi:hypothetical protein
MKSGERKSLKWLLLQQQKRIKSRLRQGNKELKSWTSNSTVTPSIGCAASPLLNAPDTSVPS